MRGIATLLLSLFWLSTAGSVYAEQKDVVGCNDHPLFTRMPTYWIHYCQHVEFDAFLFATGVGKTTRVEGETWKLSYYPQATAASRPSALQILRNFQNAIRAQGGSVAWTDDKGRETLRLDKDGVEYWVDVTAEFTGKYGLTIVQRKAMAQDIVANAAALAEALRANGHVSVGGIFFDTGKTDLKPESQAAIAEVAKLLKADPTLKLYVVGHTDNVGTFDSNVTLSQGRADAVLRSLVQTHGIAAARLRAFGDGPTAPVASNDAEDGRARNRRVELVKQ